jgi:hypothetical protein
MFNRLLSTAFFCLFTLIASGCGGGNANILDLHSPINVRSGNATLENVARTIITASAIKGWQPEVAGEGHIIATRHHTGHVAKVNITYTSESFNITYLDSDNLEYNGKTISPVYHQWVKELRDEIKRRLSKL